MKRFLVVASQGGGCDYTIGCGMKNWVENAESIEELKTRIEAALMAEDEEDDNWDDNYSGHLRISRHTEQSYDSLEIYEFDNYQGIGLQSLAKKFIEKSEQKRTEEKLAYEKAEYEKLKKKFG